MLCVCVGGRECGDIVFIASRQCSKHGVDLFPSLLLLGPVCVFKRCKSGNTGITHVCVCVCFVLCMYDVFVPSLVGALQLEL